jgi:hypothetical protein
VQFSGAFVDSLTGDAQRILDVVRVRVRLPRRPKESAELTINVTDVRRIKVTIDVEICGAAVLLAAHCVRQFAETIQIVGAEKRDAVFERKSPTAFNFAADVV